MIKASESRKERDKLDHIEKPVVAVGPIGKPEYRLQDLVGGISGENRHREMDWAAPIGREWAWHAESLPPPILAGMYLRTLRS